MKSIFLCAVVAATVSVTLANRGIDISGDVGDDSLDSLRCLGFWGLRGRSHSSSLDLYVFGGASRLRWGDLKGGWQGLVAGR